MESHYFRLLDDLHLPGRWELNALVDAQGRKLEPRTFRRGEPVQVDGPLRIHRSVLGSPLDISLLSGAPVPVVHARVAELLARLAPEDVQLIAARVDGQSEPHSSSTSFGS